MGNNFKFSNITEQNTLEQVLKKKSQPTILYSFKIYLKK